MAQRHFVRRLTSENVPPIPKPDGPPLPTPPMPPGPINVPPTDIPPVRVPETPPQARNSARP